MLAGKIFVLNYHFIVSDLYYLYVPKFYILNCPVAPKLSPVVPRNKNICLLNASHAVMITVALL
jgi:hypothetical protein